MKTAARSNPMVHHKISRTNPATISAIGGRRCQTRYTNEIHKSRETPIGLVADDEITEAFAMALELGSIPAKWLHIIDPDRGEIGTQAACGKFPHT